MSKRDSVTTHCKALGITDTKLRNDLRNHVLNFLKRENSVKSVSKLRISQIQNCAYLFLKDDEGKQVLSDCRQGNDWNGYMGSAVGTLNQLVKIWFKSEKQRESKKRKQIENTENQPHTGSNALQVESNQQPLAPSKPVAVAERSNVLTSSTRLPLAAIDRVEHESESSQQLEGYADGRTDDELPELSVLLTPRKRVDISRNARENWSPDTEPERRPEDTEAVEVVAGNNTTNAPLTPHGSSHALPISPPITELRVVRKREEDNENHNLANIQPTKRVRRDSDATIRPPESSISEDLLTVRHDRSGSTGLSSSRDEAQSRLTTVTSEALRSPIIINATMPSVTCLLTSNILISSQEVQLTHEDLTKVPSMVITYLQELEHHLKRKGNTNMLGKEQRRLYQEKSRLLEEVRSDIVMKILDIAQGSSKQGTPLEEDDDVSSSVVYRGAACLRDCIRTDLYHS